MSLVISGNLVLADSASGGGVINANNPVVGWMNQVTAGSVAASSEDPANPVTNIANPSTNLRWVGMPTSPPTEDVITISLDGLADLDYLGIARHNFGSAGIAVALEYLEPDSSPESWVELAAVLPATDSPIIFRFAKDQYVGLRLVLQPGTEAPYIGVVYAGELLVLQRRIYVGHTPITMGVSSKVVNGKSESGDFLGRIVLNEEVGTRVTQNNLTPAWVRTYLIPFLEAARKDPFFFAWRPSDYPAEVGYCWLTNDPQPENMLGNGMMKVDLSMKGIA